MCRYERLIHLIPYKNNAMNLTFTIRMLLRMSPSALKRVFYKYPQDTFYSDLRTRKLQLSLRNYFFFVLFSDTENVTEYMSFFWKAWSQSVNLPKFNSIYLFVLSSCWLHFISPSLFSLCLIFLLILEFNLTQLYHFCLSLYISLKLLYGPKHINKLYISQNSCN